METPIKQPITPQRQAGKPGIDDPDYSGNPAPVEEPVEMPNERPPERDPSTSRPPRDLPPDPERDPDNVGHDIEVEGP